MKKILFAAFAASLLAAGCQKTEIVGTTPTNGPEMTFTTGMSKLTKAQGTVAAENSGQKNLEAQDFSVWAYADPDQDFSTAPAPVTNGIYDGIENLLVECKTPSVPAEGETQAKQAGWATTKQYYWPGPNKELMFFAVSAKDTWLRPTSTNATCPVDIKVPGIHEATATTITINEFTVANDANEDLMIADYVKQHQEKKTVDLTFRHTLAKVEFIFKLGDYENIEGTTPPVIYVQSLSMTSLKNKGQLVATLNTAAATATATTNWNFVWTPDATTTTFTDHWATEVTYPSGLEEGAGVDKTALLLTQNDQSFSTWLMLPQDLTQDNKVSVTYIIDKRQFTSTFDLRGTDASLNKWDRNQHIKYTVTLAPNLITFNASAEEWLTNNDVEYVN